VAGLVFGKKGVVCTFISCNSSLSVRFQLTGIKEDVGLRVTDGIGENSENVSLDMVTVLLWVQHLFPNLVK